jgi:hypothetical protein
VYGPWRDLIGLAAYRAAGGQPIIMALVHQVLAELSAHVDGCDCGCAYSDRCDPVQIWRTAGYWQRQAKHCARTSSNAWPPCCRDGRQTLACRRAVQHELHRKLSDHLRNKG